MIIKATCSYGILTTNLATSYEGYLYAPAAYEAPQMMHELTRLNKCFSLSLKRYLNLHHVFLWRLLQDREAFFHKGVEFYL
jgi:hypothetical protein